MDGLCFLGTTLKGSLSNTGPCKRVFGLAQFVTMTMTPVDATISFPNGLTVGWNGSPLGSLQMGDINVTANVGASIDLDAQFQVADVGHLTDFTKVEFA
jgi:hypothetical protein